MSAARIERTAPKDYLRTLNVDTYRRAYEKGLSLSALLHREVTGGEDKDPLADPFDRLLREADIKVRSIPEQGIWADTFDKFMATVHGRMLAVEWIARTWRRVAAGNSFFNTNRALYTSTDAAANTASNQVTYAQQARTNQQIAPAIPLSELLAITTGIVGDTYKAYYIQNDTAGFRKNRVAEGADVPATKLIGGDQTTKLHKFGRRIVRSYEMIRRQRIDRLALLLQLMAAQSESDKVAAVIDVMVNGDGNSGTAATSYALTTLDSTATVGTLTLKAWIAFLMKFVSPYMATVALAQDTVVQQQMLLNAGSANIPLAFMPTTLPVGKFRPINKGLDGDIGVGWTADAPASKIVAADARFAIERVYEIGGDIQEVERFSTNQVEQIVMTEVEGYDKFDAFAVKVLDLTS